VGFDEGVCVQPDFAWFGTNPNMLMTVEISMEKVVDEVMKLVKTNRRWTRLPQHGRRTAKD